MRTWHIIFNIIKFYDLSCHSTLSARISKTYCKTVGLFPVSRCLLLVISLVIDSKMLAASMSKRSDLLSENLELGLATTDAEQPKSCCTGLFVEQWI